MDKLNEYNVTAQVVDKSQVDKQTILFNDSIFCATTEEAAQIFNKTHQDIYNILKIYSITKVTP